ncbi:uncharacterized protein V6R79_022230 [Siganus canaliculatus]
MAASRPQRSKTDPKQEATYFSSLGKDKDGFDISEEQRQPADEVTCPSLGNNIGQTSKEMHVQPTDGAMCSFFMDNLDQEPADDTMYESILDIIDKTHVPADVATCNFLGGNTEQMPKEIQVQPTDVATCTYPRDNVDQMPEEIHVKPTDVATCSSHRDNVDQMPEEIHVKPTDVATCSSHRDNVDQSCEHDLVSEEISSLEKCAACGGPFAPLKWFGERCQVCYQSWHKICYLKHMNITEPLPLASEEQSSSQVTSEEEYVPDSNSNSNSSCEDRLQLSKMYPKHLEVQNFEVSTSKSASKQKKHYQKNLLNKERESVSEDEESLPEDSQHKST